ncbi:MAG: hypothetical protein ACXWPS_08110 [Ktedonobacteraceae bacterium]
MTDLKAKYELGQIAYILQESTINHFVYIKAKKIIGIRFGLNGLMTYDLIDGFSRREQDMVVDLEEVKKECIDLVKRKADDNLKMLEREENIEKVA